MRNNFSDETKELFFWNHKCFYCGKSHANCFHHVLGRVSDSPLNCCPINNFDCHIGNGYLSQFETIKILLKHIYVYLVENGYVLTKQDKEFMKKYSKYYDN